MAVSQGMFVSSFPVATNATTARTLDKSTNQYKAVALTTNGEATINFTTNVQTVVGILQNSPTTSQVAAVCVSGVTQFRMAANTVDVGEAVGASSIGLGIAPTSDNWKIGTVVYGSSGGAGRLVTINLQIAHSS